MNLTFGNRKVILPQPHCPTIFSAGDTLVVKKQTNKKTLKILNVP